MLAVKNALYTIVIVAVCFLSVTFAQAAEEVRFSWAVLLDSESGTTALDFSTPQSIQKGSTLQLYLHPDDKTYIYIFLLDSSNYFAPIFPNSDHYYDSYPPGEAVRVPAGQDRFTIVPPAGQEKFYMVASAERLTSVEKTMEACYQNPEDIENQAQLFQKIRLLRRKHSKLTQVTEKGVPVSGTRRSLAATRGADAPDSFVATQVIADGFYSKIIRLNHE